MALSTETRNLYIERENKRRLNSFPAYNSLNLGASISFGIFLFLLLNALDFSGGSFNINMTVFLVALVYFIPAAISYCLARKVKSEILKNGDVSTFTRRFGFLLLPFTLAFNVFVAIAGFMIIKRERSVEYLLAAWSVLTSVAVMAISLVNVFKPAVSPTFFLGMGFLATLAVFYIIVTVLINRWVRDQQVDKRMLPFAVLLIITAVSGNLFALALGLVLLSKIKNQGKEKNIEWVDVLRRLFRNNTAILGMFFVAFLFMVSICSGLTFDNRVAVDSNFQTLLSSPTLRFPFGTDEFGRCVFTRIIFGARISLIVGLVSTAIPIVIGGILGAIAGHYGNVLDNTIMRFLDILFAVPNIFLAIAIIAAFGVSITNLIIALSVGMIPIYARTMRAQVLSVSNSEFVEAAKANGQKRHMIVIKHIIPNSMAPIIVRASLGIGSAVLSTSALSFLGLGVEPHVPEWGNVLRTGSRFLELHPYLAIYPGLAIVLIVLAFNYFGDGLRDALDPKLK